MDNENHAQMFKPSSRRIIESSQWDMRSWISHNINRTIPQFLIHHKDIIHFDCYNSIPSHLHFPFSFSNSSSSREWHCISCLDLCLIYLQLLSYPSHKIHPYISTSFLNDPSFNSWQNLIWNHVRTSI